MPDLHLLLYAIQSLHLELTVIQPVEVVVEVVEVVEVAKQHQESTLQCLVLYMQRPILLEFQLQHLMLYLL
jgi:hypothetical protein